MAAEKLASGQDLVKMHLCALYVVHLTWIGQVVGLASSLNKDFSGASAVIE